MAVEARNLVEETSHASLKPDIEETKIDLGRVLSFGTNLIQGYSL